MTERQLPEVLVERDEYPVFGLSPGEHLRIRGAGHFGARREYRVSPLAKRRNCRSGKVLVGEDSHIVQTPSG